jgi:AraC-like DNA-binding protein
MIDLNAFAIAPRRDKSALVIGDETTHLSVDFDTGIDADDFAYRLKEMRLEVGLTQVQVAEHLTETLGFRVTNKTINSYETNMQGRTRSVRLDIVLEIAALCGFDPAKLFAKKWSGLR